MWFKFERRRKRRFECNFVYWNNLFVAFVWLFVGYTRAPSYYPANTVRGLFVISNFVICAKLLPFRNITVFKWIFVSFKFQVSTMKNVLPSIWNERALIFFHLQISISGSSGNIYAYLSEFHNSRHRGRAIMGSAVIFGLSCSLLPLIAWMVINHDWQFAIPLIGIIYKPWRLFLVVCSLPGFLVFVILIFLPESPKFVLSQGKPMEAYKILQTVNRVNNGKNAQLELFEIYEETETIENRKRIEESKKSRFPLLTSVWIQTAPLVKPPHLLTTILICTIQFSIFATSTGFYMFFAEILNKMATNLDNFVDQRMMMCDIIHMKPAQFNGTTNEVSFYGKMSWSLCTAMLF